MTDSMPEAYASLNQCWAMLICEELWRLGVTDICLAPGSRSSPLTIAVAADDRLRKHVHFDERGLGFFALGLARARRRTVAVITTSGTAVANLYPALIEAAMSRVPLLILAADRPFELYDCGANQTIRQQGIFADYPVWQRSLPAPDLSLPIQSLLGTLDEAVWHAEREQGPVHLNLSFRDPLYPAGSHTEDFSHWLKPLANWHHSDKPLNQFCQSVSPCHSDRDAIQGFLLGAGVIVVSQLATRQEAELVLALAERTGWWLLADCQSGLGSHPRAISNYDLLLHNERFLQALRERPHLLQIGGRLLSKRLQAFLDNTSFVQYWLLEPSQGRMNQGHNQHQRICQPILPTLEVWLRELPESKGELTRESTAWQQAITMLLADSEGSWNQYNELGAVRCLSQLLPADSALCLGNSLPVRLFDMLAVQRPDIGWLDIHTSRGASGIDGLIATACGYGCYQPKPTTLLIGDLSFFYDLNSLLLTRQLQQPLIVVLLNNDGGGIFHKFPLQDQPDLVANYYQCAHGLDGEHAALQFGLSYSRPESLCEFALAYQQALASRQSHLIELTFPAGESVQLLEQLGVACRGITLL